MEATQALHRVRVPGSLVLVLLLGFQLVHVAPAQDVELYDDFEDGEILDGSPVDWNSSITECRGRPMHVENGVAHLSHDAFLFANQEFQGDVSIRMRARIAGVGALTVGVHWTWPDCPGAFSEYVSGVESRGFDIPVPCEEGDAYLFRWGGGFPCGLMDSHDFPGGFDVTEEFLFQMDVRGDSLEVRIWRPGETFPEEPLLAVEDTNFRSGQAGIVASNRVEVDFIWIRDRMIGPDDVPPPPGPRFRRGDANADGDMNIEDATSILNALFGQGAPATCEDSADANNDGEINIADGIYILNALFGPGSAPPAPHPDCGVDETDDTLSCEAFAACP